MEIHEVVSQMSLNYGELGMRTYLYPSTLEMSHTRNKSVLTLDAHSTEISYLVLYTYLLLRIKLIFVILILFTYKYLDGHLFPLKKQTKSLSCFIKWLDCEKLLSHLVHLNGFSPVWVLSCLFKFPICEKPMPHLLHWNGFSLV